ncbi:glycosyltransferase family 2 protein [Candidatus Sumerlaeota bacterium]|nr:glycosyltransferase family 2 protein [Candidatus Sumerlaeota bacterium]
MSNPLVSIITPAYNAASIIGEAITSVQAQTHRNWEMIIVDDGSTDGTAEIVCSAARMDPRIRLVRLRQNSRLAAAARNAAMRRARGEYFAFLDADDLWLPTKLLEQLRVFHAHPSAGVVCTWYDVFGDEERTRLWKAMMWRFEDPRVTVGQVMQQSLTTPTVMIRRRCFDEAGGFIASHRLATGEDSEYWIRLVAKYETHRICKVLTRVRVHAQGGSLSSTGLEQKRGRDRELLRRVIAGGALSPRQQRAYTAIFYYNSARDSLFHLQRPFRRDLYRSVATLHAPPKAIVMAALSFLPAPVLRGVLKALLRLKQA